MDKIVLFSTLLPIISAPISLILGKIHHRIRNFFNVFVTALTFSIALFLILVLKENPVYYEIWNIFGIKGMVLSLNLDSLGLFMLCLISFLSFLVTIYSLSYMEKYSNLNYYYFLLLLFIGSMNGAVIAGDFISFFLFWEIMTISSFLLVIFDGTEESKKAGIKYIIMTTAGSLIMIFSIGAIYTLTGTVSIAWLIKNNIAVTGRLIQMVLIFFMIGLGVKAGVVPLHTWLPEAHPSAPSPISSLLSGVMIKVGVYMMIRIFCQIFSIPISWHLIVSFLGALTILVGVMFALVEHDAKRLLAFHSISQIGYIVLGIGVGTFLSVSGALFHLINHALFKGLLFLCMGSVIYKTQQRDLDKLGGLAKSMPLTFITCLVASLSISGVPPFNGFVSKWIIYQSLLESGSKLNMFFLVAAVFGSALTLASFMKLIYSVFLGQLPKSDIQNSGDVPWTMYTPQVILAGLCILFGIFSQYILKNLISPITGMKFAKIAGDIELVGIYNPTLTTGLVILGILIGLFIYLLSNAKKVRTVETWIGGETLDNKTMSVAGVEFYQTIKTMEPFSTIYRKEEEEKLDIYPVGISFIEWLSQFVFRYINLSVDRFYQISGRIGNLSIGILSRIHSGNVQSYILWCLFGLLILFAFIIGLN